MKSVFLFGLLVLGSVAAGCGKDAPAAPSPTSSSATLNATLLPSSEMPPIVGAEASGSGAATLRINVTKDSSGNITAASLDVTVSATGFPAGTSLTASHIHTGGAGSNGGIFVGFGLNAGEAAFPSGSGSFSKQNVAVTAEQATSILSNPSAFYVNIHTAANPGGAARGQLIRVQ